MKRTLSILFGFFGVCLCATAAELAPAGDYFIAAACRGSAPSPYVTAYYPVLHTAAVPTYDELVKLNASKYYELTRRCRVSQPSGAVNIELSIVSHPLVGCRANGLGCISNSQCCAGNCDLGVNACAPASTTATPVR